MPTAACVALLTVLFAADPDPAQAPVSLAVPAQAAFEDGEIAFGRGEFARAIAILRPLLYPQIRLPSEGQVVQAHRMLGVAFLYENQPVAAREEFLRLLELRPAYRFDPLLDPQAVVDFFNQVLREQEARIAELEARARRARQAEEESRRRALERATVVERHYAHNAYLLNFVPFGAGQFQNGHRGKGWVFLGVESALGLTSVAAFTLNFALYGFTPTIGCKIDSGANPCPAAHKDFTERDRSERLTQVQMISGGLFFAVAAWGIVDALIHYEPFTVLGHAPGTATTAPRTGRGDEPPRPSLAPRLDVGPLPLPDGAGLRLRIRL